MSTPTNQLSQLTRRLRRVSWVLMAGAALIAIYVVSVTAFHNQAQQTLQKAWTRTHPSVALVSTGGAPVHHAHLADGQPIGRLIIPAISFNDIVAEGADRGILSGGPGHDDQTDYPGEGGLVLISNHNGFSGSWNDIHVGDTVEVEMSYGLFRYIVDARSIVSGNDTTVLGRAYPHETLLISTCWPLWAGAAATQRLVFEAHPG